MVQSSKPLGKALCVFGLFFFLADNSQSLSSNNRPGGSSHSDPRSMIDSEFAAVTDDHHVKNSPAVAAIREVDVARRIIKQRSSRSRPPELPPEEDSTRKSPQRIEVQQPPFSTAKESKKRSIATKGKSKVYQNPNHPMDLSYASAIKALRVYHDQHSHLILPRKFTIQHDDKYPKEWYGLDLAGTVYDMKWWTKHVKEQPERVAELNKLGFVWERLQPEWNLILESLVIYRTLNSNLLVPVKFVVPFGDKEWPRSTWGISLGQVVYRIRSRGDFLRGATAIKRRRQLESIGFVWDVSEHLFDTFCRVFQIYSKTTGSQRPGAMKIPSHYVVPESKEWPRDLWGYRLGEKCTAIRQKELYIKDHPDRLRKLIEIGFHAGGNDSLKWLEVVHAAAVYSQMNGRNLDVPQQFIVPGPPRVNHTSIGEVVSEGSGVVGSDDAWPWPGETIPMLFIGPTRHKPLHTVYSYLSLPLFV